jgi:acetolactate synthase I/II/III large subunit
MTQETMTGAQAFARTLRDCGVPRVHGYTGGSILPVFDALGQSGLEVVIHANEQAAAFAAAGTSRSSTGIGVCVVTSGPSATNTLTAVLDTRADSEPLVLVTGQVLERKYGKDVFQFSDVSDIFRTAAKRVVRVSAHHSVENVVKKAFAFAATGKPGPVVIDFPLDRQQAPTRYSGLSLDKFHAAYPSPGSLSDEHCREFSTILQEAKRPLIYIGGGLNNPKASWALRAFNARFRIPVVNTLMGKGVLDELADPYALGMLGMFGLPAPNFAVQETDLFIALGVRWDDRVAEHVGAFGPRARIIYYDINPAKVAEIVRDRSPLLSAVVDGSQALHDLLAYAERHQVKGDHAAWRRRALKLKRCWPLAYNRASPRIQGAAVIEMLDEKKPADALVTTGVGNHQMLAAQYLRFSHPQQFLTSGSFGTMGFGLPTAIGAQYANPGTMVIDVDGDGSLTMNIGELRTLALYDLPVKVLILNNQGDGMVRNLQDRSYGGRRVGTTRQKEVFYAGCAQSLGISAARVKGYRALGPAMDAWLAAEGPSLLEVMTDPEEMLYPRIPAGMAYHDMDLGPYIKERP